MFWLRPGWCSASWRVTRFGVVAAIVAVLVGVPGTASAIPAVPPAGPVDAQVDTHATDTAAADAAARAAADAAARVATDAAARVAADAAARVAAEVRTKVAVTQGLQAQLAQAESQLHQLNQQLEFTLELANKAVVDLGTAQQAVAAAEAAQSDAAQAVADTSAAVAQADQQAARFAVSSFQQGSTIGSFSAYLAARSPQDLLDRTALLNAVSGSQLQVMQNLGQARARSVDAAATVRASKEAADVVVAATASAKDRADRATRAAVTAQQDQAARAQQLQLQRDKALYELDTANALPGAGLSLEQWGAQHRASTAAADRALIDEARRQVSAGGLPGTGPASTAAQTVIRRAISQLGVPYAWGGGNAAGPTPGTRDGGVADSYGDFAKVGFDCSGLMMYAFAGAGVSLPHYTGYQYSAGKQIPLVQLQPGDMLFYSPGGIHHVALYIGAGKMIEAPQSGAYVTVSPLRLDDAMPYAIRAV